MSRGFFTCNRVPWLVARPGGEGNACDGSEKSQFYSRVAGLGASSPPRSRIERELVAYLTYWLHFEEFYSSVGEFAGGGEEDYIFVHRKQN